LNTIYEFGSVQLLNGIGKVIPKLYHSIMRRAFKKFGFGLWTDKVSGFVGTNLQPINEENWWLGSPNDVK
jgi:hypothetical protein